jgi:hypothetical protein
VHSLLGSHRYMGNRRSVFPPIASLCSVGFSKRLVNVNERACALRVLSGCKYTWSGTCGEAFALSHLLHYFLVLALAYPEFLPRQLEWTTTNGCWRSRQVSVGRHCLFALACVIRGKGIRMVFKFEGSTYIDHACS